MLADPSEIFVHYGSNKVKETVDKKMFVPSKSIKLRPEFDMSKKPLRKFDYAILEVVYFFFTLY